MSESQAKKWCFTLNNYTKQEYDKCLELESQYTIIGKEVGEQGTPHLQGFYYFNKRKTMRWIKRRTTDRIHLEIARGTVAENIAYCSKENNYTEKGERPPEQHESGGLANKRKWEDAVEAARAGKFEDIPRDLWIKYRNSFKTEYQEYNRQQTLEIDDQQMKEHFLWLYGPTGTGKSHMAREYAKNIDPEHEPYLKLLNKWWNGYNKQKVVIIEEANPESCQHLGHFFKQWADKWTFPAEVKGGIFTEGIRPEYIIVTSNYSIEECFPSQQDYAPLKRRFYEYYKNSKHDVWWWYPAIPEELRILDESTQLMGPSTQLTQENPMDPCAQIQIERSSPLIPELCTSDTDNL